MPIRNLSIILLAALLSLTCYVKAERNHYASLISEGMRLVSTYALQEVNNRALFEGAMQGMVAPLDRYSRYIPPEEYQPFRENLDQEFGGVGIVVELDPETARLTVLSPVVGTPAYRAGIQAGDVILQIDDESTEGMSLTRAVQLMRGRPGTSVRVSVQADPEAPIRNYSVNRDVIPMQSVLGDTRNPDDSWSFRLFSDPQIGYVRVTTFGELSASELGEALAGMNADVDGLIIDIRNNAGGLLDAAVEICDMLLPGGTIVSTRGRGGEVRRIYQATPGQVLDGDIPLVILVNRYSASASEIMAACLQDHGRAVIVGERTWGKGTVQNVFNFEGGRSALKLTTSSYWRPSGVNIHRDEDASEADAWGVSPDPGSEVRMEDDAMSQQLELRRQRDIVRPTGEAPPVDETEAANQQLEVDPQLRRALELLTQEARQAAA